MGQPRTFSVLRLTTPYTSPVKILLEVKEGENWKTVLSEDKPKGNEWVKNLPAGDRTGSSA